MFVAMKHHILCPELYCVTGMHSWQSLKKSLLPHEYVDFDADPGRFMREMRGSNGAFSIDGEVHSPTHSPWHAGREVTFPRVGDKF